MGLRDDKFEVDVDYEVCEWGEGKEGEEEEGGGMEEDVTTEATWYSLQLKS